MAPDRVRFAYSRRLTTAGEIQRVSRGGSAVRGEVCTARVAHSARLRGRCAIIVPRHGQTAVLRNRLKRRTREMVRRLILPVLGPFDIVIRMRSEAYEAAPETISTDILKLQRTLKQRRAV